jgi:RNA recognition motif-containing protein
MTTIYVGNLSYKASDEQLQELFETFGPVKSARIITDKFTGRSKGFAFIEMENASDAQTAISNLHEKEFLQRNIIVNEARPREERDR